MSHVQSKQFSEFSFYITAQIDKINIALQNHNKLTTLIQQINTNITKQQRRMDVFDGKMKLLEIYQSENFKNNQRIFNSQPIYQIINQKICLLQEMQTNIFLGEKREKNYKCQDQIIILQRRVGQVQAQIQRIKSKNVVLNQFRREISPSLPNCDSTKDISIDGSNKRQLKRLQTKIHDYINQKLKALQKRLISNSINHSLSKDPLFNLERNLSQTVTEREGDTYQIIDRKNINKYGKQKIRCQIDNYYNQPTQKQQLSKTTKSYKEKAKQKKYISKSKSKSKSKNNLKHNKSIQKAISLKSVAQYLKLTNPK